jgi:hypothetical protein
MPGTRRKPGRLGPYVEGHRSWLLELGYSPLTVTHSLTALGHLGRWMARGHVEVETLDGDAVRAFLAAYARDRGRLPTASVRPLLDYPRAQGVVAPEFAAPMSALERLLAEYREWMLGERGLAATTVRARVGLASLQPSPAHRSRARGAPQGRPRPHRAGCARCSPARAGSAGSRFARATGSRATACLSWAPPSSTRFSGPEVSTTCHRRRGGGPLERVTQSRRRRRRATR